MTLIVPYETKSLALPENKKAVWSHHGSTAYERISAFYMDNDILPTPETDLVLKLLLKEGNYHKSIIKQLVAQMDNMHELSGTAAVLRVTDDQTTPYAKGLERKLKDYLRVLSGLITKALKLEVGIRELELTPSEMLEETLKDALLFEKRFKGYLPEDVFATARDYSASHPPMPFTEEAIQATLAKYA